MDSMRLNSRLSMIQRRRPTWKDPELSIGAFCGTAKGKFNYWEAQGPAQEAYDQIRSGIQDILNSSCGPVRCSSAIVYDIYMVGRSATTAIPHIMFSCKQTASRKQALEAVRKSHILRQSPGIELGHWEYPPHILNLQLLASGALQVFGNAISPPTYCLRAVYDAQRPSENLAIQIMRSQPVEGSMQQRTATIGSLVEHNGKVFYLAPEHIYATQETLQSKQEVRSTEDDSECEFGPSLDSDEVTDDEVDFMSQYSASPANSDIDSDSSPDTDIDDFDFSDDEDEMQPIPQFRASRRVADDGSSFQEPVYAPIPLLELDTIEQPVHDPTISSTDLDYALVEVSDSTTTNGMPLFSRHNVAEIAPGLVDVMTVTGSGRFLHGRLSGRPSHVRVPGGTVFQDTYTVQFDGPLLPGDSGSMVRDMATGKIYGHIFMGSVESRVAYIMPAVSVLQHLEQSANVDGVSGETTLVDTDRETLTDDAPSSTHFDCVGSASRAQDLTIGRISVVGREPSATRSMLDDILPRRQGIPDLGAQLTFGKKNGQNVVVVAPFCPGQTCCLSCCAEMASKMLGRLFPNTRRTLFERICFRELKDALDELVFPASYTTTVPPTQPAEGPMDIRSHTPGHCPDWRGGRFVRHCLSYRSPLDTPFGRVWLEGIDTGARLTRIRNAGVFPGPTCREIDRDPDLLLNPVGPILGSAGRASGHVPDCTEPSVPTVPSASPCPRCQKTESQRRLYHEFLVWLVCVPEKPPQHQHLAGSRLTGPIDFTRLEPENGDGDANSQ